MDVHYTCDTKNRYNGFLDSDHGNSLETINTNAARKRKNKKKRAPKIREKCNSSVQTDDLAQLPKLDDADNKQLNDIAMVDENDVENEQADTKADCAKNVDDEHKQMDISTTNCESNKEIAVDSNKADVSQSTVSETAKWSEICFEEEKALMDQMAHVDESESKSTESAESDLMVSNKKNYPTIYFYNSNFGNGARNRTVYHEINDRNVFQKQTNDINDGNNNENDTKVFKKRRARGWNRKRANNKQSSAMDLDDGQHNENNQPVKLEQNESSDGDQMPVARSRKKRRNRKRNKLQNNQNDQQQPMANT